MNIPMQPAVKCPLLFEHEPYDLIKLRNCYKCKHFVKGKRFKIECGYEP